MKDSKELEFGIMTIGYLIKTMYFLIIPSISIYATNRDITNFKTEPTKSVEYYTQYQFGIDINWLRFRLYFILE